MYNRGRLTKCFYSSCRSPILDPRRDIILAVNDGLVSTFLLVVGVFGAGMNSTNILLTSISGLIAGKTSWTTLESDLA